MTSDERPTVALIHASPASLVPAGQAFAAGFPGARVLNLLDDRLVSDAEDAGGLTPALRDRMASLIEYAVDAGAQAIQLTCSMYGPVATSEAARRPLPVFASDQAMFAAVRDSGATRIAVLGSLVPAAEDSAARLREVLVDAGRATDVRHVVVDGARDAASAGDQTELTRLMVGAAVTVAPEVDVILIGQYSLAPTRDAIAEAVSVPVFSPPQLAATALRAVLEPGA